jgi:hypothetical protein
LQSDPALFGLWLACAGCDDKPAGILAEIVNRAEAESLGRAEPSTATAGDESAAADLPAKKSPARQTPAPAAGAETIADADTAPAGNAETLAFPLDGFEPSRHGDAGGDLAPPQPPASLAARKKGPLPAKPMPGNPPAATPGRQCLDWIVEGVASGRLACNSRDARVHGVPEGVLLASPGIFQDYAKAAGLDDFGKIQVSFFKLKRHRTTPAGHNIHSYAVAGQGTRVNGVLLADPQAIFGSGFPGPNPMLERL